MKPSAPLKKSKGSLGKVSKNKVVKKREKDSVIGKKKAAAVFELAAETLPSPDKKRLAKSLKNKKSESVSRTNSSGVPQLTLKTSKKLTNSISGEAGEPKKLIKALKRERGTEEVGKQKPLKKVKAVDNVAVKELNGSSSLQKKLKASQNDKGAIRTSKTPKTKVLKKIVDPAAGKKKEKEVKAEFQQLDRKLLVGVCSNALKVVKEEQEALSGKNLFESDPKEIMLQVEVFKVPRTPYQYNRCLVPHQIYPSEPEVCLIVSDLFRGRRTDVGFAQYQETYEGRLQRTGVTGVKMLMPFTQLRYEFRPFEMRRRLIDSYDVFLCDGRIYGHVAQFFGKLLKKRPLIPIHAIERDSSKIVKFTSYLQDEVDKGMRKVCYAVTPHGSSINVRNVGHSGLSEDQLADNVEEIWKSLHEHLPGGIPNVKSVYVKGPVSASVPLYASFTPLKKVPVGKFRDIGEPVEDELSTMPGRSVIVHPRGQVKVVDNPDEEDEQFITQQGLKRVWKNPKDTNADADAGSDVESSDDEAEVADDETSRLAELPRMEIPKDTKPKVEVKVEDGEESEDDLAAAEEAAYLHSWSESQSMKELEEEENKKNEEPKKKKKRKAPSKPTSKPGAKSIPTKKNAVSKKFSNAKVQKKNLKNAAKKKA